MKDDWKLLELTTRKPASKPLLLSNVFSLTEKKALQAGGNDLFTDDSKSVPV